MPLHGGKIIGNTLPQGGALGFYVSGLEPLRTETFPATAFSYAEKVQTKTSAMTVAEHP